MTYPSPEKNGEYKVRYKEKMDERRALLRSIRADYTKAAGELEMLRAEVIKSLRGESAFSQSLLGSLIADAETKCLEVQQQLDAAQAAYDEKQAAERFEQWIGKRRFCRKELKTSVHPKRFKGIFLPCWTFDTHTDTTYDASYGISYQGSKGAPQLEWDGCCGSYREFIDDQVVDGRNRREQDLLDLNRDFQVKENKAYRQEYLAGFAVERYSIDLMDAWECAKEKISARLQRHVTNRIMAERHADEVADLKMSTVYTRIKYKLLLLPVWVICFDVNGKLYRFTVNGQNGSVSGKIPVSPAKVASVVLGVLVILGLFCSFLR